MSASTNAPRTWPGGPISRSTPRRPDYRSPEAIAWRALYKTPRWKALRANHLQAHPLCERDHGNRAVPATVVNHRKPHKGDRELFFDPSNLESVCKPHHDGPIQREEVTGFSPEVDADGFPTDPRHRANLPRRP